MAGRCARTVSWPPSPGTANVEVLFKRFGAPDPAEAYTRLPRVSLHEVAADRGAARALLYGRARLTGVPRADARGLSPELRRAAMRAASVPDRGRVIADGPIAAALLAMQSVPYVYLAHNVESSLRPTLPNFRRAYGSQRTLRRFERRLLLSARETWMSSRRDVELAQELAPQARLRYVPNVVDVSSIQPEDIQRRAPGAMFVGDYSYPPNVRALQFLVDDVMPRVWARMPEAELLAVGHHLSLPAGTDPRVRPLGFVAQMDNAYARAASCGRAAVGGRWLSVEVRRGSGPRASGRGDVRAAGGLEVEDGVHYRRAEGPEAFADALVDVLRDGAPELAAHGRELAEQEYSIEALATILRP